MRTPTEAASRSDDLSCPNHCYQTVRQRTLPTNKLVPPIELSIMHRVALGKQDIAQVPVGEENRRRSVTFDIRLQSSDQMRTAVPLHRRGLLAPQQRVVFGTSQVAC